MHFSHFVQKYAETLNAHPTLYALVVLLSCFSPPLSYVFRLTSGLIYSWDSVVCMHAERERKWGRERRREKAGEGEEKRARGIEGGREEK